MALVNIDPPVVILLDAADGAQFGLDADTMLGLADGIRNSLGRIAAVSDHLRLPDGVPLKIIVRLLGDDGPADGEDDQWVRVAADAEMATVELGLGVGVLEQFIGDGIAGHEIIGTALHEMIRRVRQERGDDPGTAKDKFLQAWSALGPISRFTTRNDSLPSVAPADTLPRTEAVRIRALRPVFDLVGQRVAPGSFTDDDAHQICQDVLLPAIEQRLQEQLGDSRPDLLRELAVRLNAARAEHLRRSRQVAYALTGPWAANWRELAFDEDTAMSAHAAEVLFEFALAQPPHGDQPADSTTVAELAALTEFLLIVAGLDNGYEHTLHGLRVDIYDDGPFTVRPSRAAAAAASESDQSRIDVDLDSYHRALREDHIARASEPSATSEYIPTQDDVRPSPFRQRIRLPNDYRPVRAVLTPSQLAVDDHLTAAWAQG